MHVAIKENSLDNYYGRESYYIKMLRVLRFSLVECQRSVFGPMDGCLRRAMSALFPYRGVCGCSPLSKEANTLFKKLAALLAEKCEKPYSQVSGYVNARMSVAIVRATPLCLRGSRIPTSKTSRRLPQWEDKAGLGGASSDISN
jgi:hypothetical protein